MSSDLPPVNQARPKSEPSSKRNRIRDKNATNACDEAAQTDLPLAKLTTDASTSPVQDSDMPPPPASTNHRSRFPPTFTLMMSSVSVATLPNPS